ncbi:MAG: PPC domain-containing DNA-binding protein [Thermoplasmata archaeon]
MISRKNGNIIIAKLEKDDDVFESIDKLISKYSIAGGIIVSGVGMLKNFEIGYWNGKEYEKKFIEKNHELVAMHGSIAETDPKIHIHVGLAGPDHMLTGGHLISGKADPMVELTILDTGFPMQRVYNDKTSLKELNFH